MLFLSTPVSFHAPVYLGFGLYFLSWVFLTNIEIARKSTLAEKHTIRTHPVRRR
eukprot:XP_001705243.1 Hypothetical protein GL50803_10942 [Giardia lamblia ATCC 50803]